MEPVIAICLTESNEEIKCPQCKTVYHNDCISQWVKINHLALIVDFQVNLAKYYRVQDEEYNIIDEIKKLKFEHLLN